MKPKFQYKTKTTFLIKYNNLKSIKIIRGKQLLQNLK